ncbi:IS6 family transposase [Adonisia turfae]|uniref:IS6 family transposase n=1 Tax=Adonisia turfae CCMR0081 TaxID=2292702 RepID=A0A6M0RS46_9CYAN|nr:IS6 family transposase [Adonisia turfae]NEZ58680.1 IS6 family transposase [Adonisia turfae CCMR0081]
MSSSESFKWRHFKPEIILLNVRWYLRYSLSYRDLEEMMLERGLKVDHTTICRWVQAYSPEIDKCCRPYLRPTNDSWRVDETYIKIKKVWKYLYRAIDSEGNMLDSMLSARRDAKAAKRFLTKVLNSAHTVEPRVITVDKNAAYPPAIENLKKDKALPETTETRQIKYLNNIVEQDHRFIKRKVNPGLGFGSFNTARRTLRGYETMNMIRKGQINGIDKGDIIEQISFISKIFEVTA